MNISDLDLNLLVVFDAMVRHGNLTAAGRELGLSQPAVSYALVKMRKAFGDPLFVRVSYGMQPTPHALQMVDTVRDVLHRIRSDLLNPVAFDPAQSDREFHIAASDVGESFFVPILVKALRSHGAHLRLRVYSPTPSALKEQMESGDIDLAIGYYPDLVGADFFQQALFTSNFVVIARRGNPHAKGKLTMERLLKAPHVDVSTPGRSQEVILRTLAQLKISREVPLHVSRFLTLLDIVLQSDLVAIVPREVAYIFRGATGLAVHPLPFESPQFRLKQHWHKRFNDEPALKWLRKLAHELFRNAGDLPLTEPASAKSGGRE